MKDFFSHFDTLLLGTFWTWQKYKFYEKSKFILQRHSQFNATSLISFCHCWTLEKHDILSAAITNTCISNFDHIDFTWMDNRSGCWRRRCWRWCRPGPAAWQSSPSGSWRPGTHPKQTTRRQDVTHDCQITKKHPLKKLFCVQVSQFYVDRPIL